MRFQMNGRSVRNKVELQCAAVERTRVDDKDADRRVERTCVRASAANEVERYIQLAGLRTRCGTVETACGVAGLALCVHGG